MRLATASLAMAVVVCVGCGRPATPSSAGETSGSVGAVAEATGKPAATSKPAPGVLDQERAELKQIPDPLKSHYLAVSTQDAWLNPFVVVGTDSLKVIVFMGDANPSPMGAGGLLRPKNARKNIVQIAPEKLGEMLSDLPASAWPYGRVIAVEESRQAERAERAAMRRNMERALATLSNLGVVTQEWNEPSSSR